MRRVPQLSPDGARAAFTIRGNGARKDPERNFGATTQLFHNGVIVGVVDGVFQVWLDDDHVAVATYKVELGWAVFDTMTIYDGSGNPVGPARLPDPRPGGQPVTGAMSVVDGHLVYLRYRNTVYDTATGNVAWRGDPAGSNGALVGHHVVYTKGTRIYRGDFTP